jgi:hypothetical protein
MRRALLSGSSPLRAAWVVSAILACSVLTPSFAATASAANISDPALVKKVERVSIQTQPGYTVRFSEGLYDASTGDVYVDGYPDAVWRLAGDQLEPAPSSHSDSGQVSTLESCGFITYFHCEHTLVKSGCMPTTFWLNYNPDTDHFSDPYGQALNPPEQVSVRDQPYRNYGARGLRAYHDGKYGFYSDNCVDP